MIANIRISFRVRSHNLLATGCWATLTAENGGQEIQTRRSPASFEASLTHESADILVSKHLFFDPAFYLNSGSTFDADLKPLDLNVIDHCDPLWSLTK